MNSAETAAARGLITVGIPQHTIAAIFQVNSARIAEAKSAKSNQVIDAKAIGGHPVLTLELIDVLCASAAERETLLHGVFVLDPDVCAKLIDKHGHRNDGNRKLKLSKIRDEFVPDMEQDGWLLNGETIKLSDEGTLVDGQNRCTAATLADASFKSLVVFGVPRRYFHTVDVGKPRTGTDLFTIQGIRNAVAVAGAVRWIMILRSKTPHVNLTFPPQKILAYYQSRIDPDAIQESVNLSRHVYNATRIAHSLLCGLHYDLAEIDRRRANQFFDGWANGDQWFRPLNQRLAMLEAEYGGRPRPQTLTLGTILEAWIVWRKGNRLNMSGRNSLTYTRGPYENWR